MRQVEPSVLPAVVAAGAALTGIVVGFLLREVTDAIRRARERRRQLSSSRRDRALSVARSALEMASTAQSLLWAGRVKQQGVKVNAEQKAAMIELYNSSASNLVYLLQEVRLLGPEYIAVKVHEIRESGVELNSLATKADQGAATSSDFSAGDAEVVAIRNAVDAIIALVAEREKA